MVFDYKILPVQSETIDSPHEIHGFAQRRKAYTRKFRKDRRRARVDRRRSVRDGVFVSLSANRKTERRRGGDRRRVGGDRRRSSSRFVL